MLDIIAQGIGILAMIANVIAFQFKEKTTLLLCQMIGSVLFVINLFMLGATMGGILHIVAILRAAAFMNRERLRIPSRVLAAGFILLYCTSYVLVFTVFGTEPTALNLIVELLPLIAMSAITIGISGKSTKAVRLCGFINSPAWLIYNCVVFSIGGILCEVFSLVSLLSAYLRLDTPKKK